MGIGLLFSSLFKKEEDKGKKIRELDVEPVQMKSRTEPLTGAESVEPAKKEQSKAPESVQPEGFEKEQSKASERVRPEGFEKGQARDPEKVAAADEKKAYFQAKKDLYQYLNQWMKVLYQADRDDSWETVEVPDRMTKGAAESLERIKEELPANLRRLMEPFTEEANINAPAGLKQAFVSMLLPFYPAYKDQFGEFRYNTFLNRDALELFRRLTGRKFRPGFKNRYATGQPAFEWKGEQYRIYDKEGTLLCDAVFKDGVIYEGYAVVAGEGQEDGEWTVLRKGHYKEGIFTEDTVEYLYRKPIDI